MKKRSFASNTFLPENNLAPQQLPNSYNTLQIAAGVTAVTPMVGGAMTSYSSFFFIAGASMLGITTFLAGCYFVAKAVEYCKKPVDHQIQDLEKGEACCINTNKL